jgi:hypothetical protein
MTIKQNISKDSYSVMSKGLFDNKISSFKNVQCSLIKGKSCSLRKWCCIRTLTVLSFERKYLTW